MLKLNWAEKIMKHNFLHLLSAQLFYRGFCFVYSVRSIYLFFFNIFFAYKDDTLLHRRREGDKKRKEKSPDRTRPDQCDLLILSSDIQPIMNICTFHSVNPPCLALPCLRVGAYPYASASQAQGPHTRRARTGIQRTRNKEQVTDDQDQG